MRTRKSSLNPLLIATLLLLSLLVSLTSLTRLAQAAPALVALSKRLELALPPTSSTTLSSNSVAENQITGTTVGMFSTFDPGPPDTYTYTFTNTASFPDNDSFSIVSDTLTTAAIFNFEATPSYTISVLTTDSGNETIETTFIITINDVNEAPTDLALDNTDVDENLTSGATVGTFSTTDEDTGQTHTYSLVDTISFPDNALFDISGDTLITDAVFDFEADSSYTIQVRTDDGNGGTFDKPFIITINDVNETPTDISLSNTSIAENRPINTVVGTFSTTDPDTGDTHTYTLFSVTGCADAGQFNINGNQLQTDAVFDYQADNSYCIWVRTTDGGDLFTEEQFTITVTNVFPTITVTKTANPTSVPETGNNVTFTIRVTNTSQENATISIFSDNKFNLGVHCPTAVGTTITPGNNYTCTFAKFISGDYPGNHQNMATTVAGDNEGFASVASFTATVVFTDVKPNLSITYTPNPTSVIESGGNVTFSALVTNLSAETGTLTLLQDSTFGDLNGQGSCALNGTIAPNGGTYSCSFSKLVSGTAGQTLVYTATARLADDDGNNKDASDNASVFVGEMPKIYLPLIFKPPPTELFIKNNTGGPVTFTVVGVVTCNVPTGHQNYPCGIFPPGTYTVQVSSICGSLTTSRTYNSGPQTTEVFCN